MKFWLVIEFTEMLQFVSTRTGYALTVLQISQLTVGRTSSSQSVTFFISRFLVAASNGGRSLPSGYPNCPCASATSFSEQLTTVEPQSLSN
jgi:hypothetical protein